MVIIAGLHGAGTRYLSKCLNREIPMWHEEAGGGHYEDKEILKINDDELNYRGVTWWKGSGKTGNIVKRLKSYKRRRKPEGFKDPRIVYLYREYLEVFPKAKYIVCVRNPLRVAQTHMNHRGLKFKEIIKWYSRDLKLSLNLKPYYFNYDNDLEKEQEQLNEFLGFEVDIITNWLKL